MKKAAKIFLVIGMLLTFFLIYPPFIGITAYRKLDDENTTKEDLTLWGILSLFFVSPIAGLLILLLKPEDLDQSQSMNGDKSLQVRTTLQIDLLNLRNYLMKV
jgi:hypothetical protein